MCRDAVVEDAVKSWLDHVIIPALIQQFVKAKKVSANSSFPSDNNGLMTNCAEGPEVTP
jgi:hypothetical protein